MNQNRDNYPSQSELHRLFNYDTDTGILTWKVAKGNVAAGREAGYLHHKGYRLVRINGISCSVHRVIWIFVKGFNPEHDIDHEQGITDDNRIDKMREVTPTCNQQNCAIRSDNSTGYSGVFFNKRRNKYQSNITITGKLILIGYFATALEAARARLDYEDECPYWHCDIRNVSRMKVVEDEKNLQLNRKKGVDMPFINSSKNLDKAKRRW